MKDKKPTSLVPSDNNPLVRIGNKIAIVNKLLSIRKKDSFNDILIYFLSQNIDLIIKYISEWSPLTESILTKYKNKWDWTLLSGNENLPWSEELIEKYKHKWEWIYLSGNQYLPWSEELIEKYKDKWTWTTLSDNENLPWSEELIEKYRNKWNWSLLAINQNIPWSEELIEKYYERWDWNKFSDEDEVSSIELLKDCFLKTLLKNKIIQKKWSNDVLEIEEKHHWIYEMYNSFFDNFLLKKLLKK
mgnify:CR=1 FL=1